MTEGLDTVLVISAALNAALLAWNTVFTVRGYRAFKRARAFLFAAEAEHTARVLGRHLYAVNSRDMQ